MILQEGEGLTVHLKPLNLGELIGSLRDAARQRASDDNRVYLDCGYFGANGLSSWRGDYAHLAITYKGPDYGEPLSVKDFLAELEGAVGRTFVGYKGGEYKMRVDTPVWVANPGEANHTAIWSITPCSDGVRLNTFWNY